MEAYKLTLKQYQKQELKKFKETKYWSAALKLSKDMRNNLIYAKLEKYKNEWYESIIEYGKKNSLTNKVIYSFDKEFGRNHLLHCFRGDRKGLNEWINADAIKL